MYKIFHRSFIILFLCSGCMVGPNYHPPCNSLPETWETTVADIKNETFPEVWNLFDDPLLAEYLKELRCANLDIKRAEAKIYEACALRKIASSKLYPTIDGRIRYSRSMPAGGILESGEAVDPLNPSSGVLGGIPLNLKQQTFLADFDAIWEIDVFGKRRREVESACASIQIQQEAWRGAIVIVMAEFGRVYIELKGTQKAIELTTKQVALLKERASLVKERVKKGLARETDWIAVEGQIGQLSAKLSNLKAQEAQSLYHLAALLGKYPGELVDLNHKGIYQARLPEMNASVPLGVPSNLLRRRPDIRESEREIVKATAEIGVAVADFFPQIRLDGTFGFQNLHLGQMRGEGESWSYGAGLLTPIFHAGKIQANVDRQKWLKYEACLEYEQTVLEALEEAESSIAKLIRTEKATECLREYYSAQQELLRKQENLYSGGLSNRLQVIETEQNAIEAEHTLIDQEVKLRVALIALYKALGGGWETSDY